MIHAHCCQKPANHFVQNSIKVETSMRRPFYLSLQNVFFLNVTHPRLKEQKPSEIRKLTRLTTVSRDCSDEKISVLCVQRWVKIMRKKISR